MCLENLGNVRRSQGNLRSAAELLGRSLAIADDTGERSPYLAGLVESIAGLAAGGGRIEDAVRLDGAAVSFRESIGAPRGPGDEELVDTDLAPARALLGDQAEQLTEEGRGIDVVAMVRLALDVCRDATREHGVAVVD